MPNTSLLQIQGLTKSFGDTQVLNNISFSMNKGEKIVILGPSGSGKSTILRCINQLETPNGGEIFLDNELVTQKNLNLLRQRIGMVFQRFNIFSHMTVLENIIEAPIHVKKMKKNDAIELAMSLLKKVGLSDKVNSLPSQLSGGQMQRVGIARALAMQPEIMLFDEPTSALDPELVGEVLSVMQSVAEEGMSMIVVTHEMGFARKVADRVLFMDGGYIIDDKPPEEFFLNPTNERCRAFINKIGHN